jgi:thiamine biosynthesis lipoprotein
VRLFTWLALLLLCACGANDSEQHSFTGHTMGTQFSVKLTTDNVDTATLTEALEASLAEVNNMMSTYQPDSEISRFNSNKTTEWQEVSQEFCFSVEEALALSAFTNGSFDITVGPLVNLWGFGPDGIVLEPPRDEDIVAMKDAVGYEHLQTDCDKPAIRKAVTSIALDMSAFGKGYAVDRIAEVLEQRGFENYLVEVGGELRFRGKNVKGENWAIGIEVPKADQRTPYAIIRLTDTAMATSGDYRNFFEADGKLYSHTIDTRTGRPVTHTLASVTVVDDEGARADALATALLVMGPVEGLAFATAQDVAALFLLRTPSGIDERSTPAFEQIRQQQ